MRDVYYDNQERLEKLFFKDYLTPWYRGGFLLRANWLRWVGYKASVAYMKYMDNRAVKSLEDPREQAYYLKERFARD